MEKRSNPSTHHFLLQYLADPECKNIRKSLLTTEYRLLSSGTIYCDIQGDWTKSDVARILLIPPLLLHATSRPILKYPLELLLRIKVSEVTEIKPMKGGGSHTTIFHPDAEIVEGIASLLTLLCRRLITVSGKSCETHSHPYRNPPYQDLGYVPFPVVKSMQSVYWPPYPYSVRTSVNGEEIIDYNPPPLAVNPETLTKLLLGLPQIECAESIVESARLYALAMEMVHQQPEIAYQLLVASVEAIANVVLKSYGPTDDKKVERQQNVYVLAKKMKLEEEQARSLAIEACKVEHWAKRKFKKFLVDNLDDSIWNQEDDLFKVLPGFLPGKENLEKILGDIYDARSSATHWGKQFPETASHAGGPTIPFRVASALFDDEEIIFPPVAWFERIVNKALRTFWEKSVKA